MTALDIIRRVVDLRVLTAGLVDVSAAGATVAEITALEFVLGRRVSESHRQLLATWNGASLDVIRIHSTKSVVATRDVIIGSRLEDGVPFADDYSGFVYVERADGSVWSLDTDGGAAKKEAATIDDFFLRVVFGSDAAKFMDKEWKQKLINAGIVPGTVRKPRDRRPAVRNAPKEAILNSGEFLRCPFCKKVFGIGSASSWDGERHLTCGQRISVKLREPGPTG